MVGDDVATFIPKNIVETLVHTVRKARVFL
jgi:hypothetical protein